MKLFKPYKTPGKPTWGELRRDYLLMFIVYPVVGTLIISGTFWGLGQLVKLITK